MKVIVFEDIPHRTTGDGTWLEAGEYRVLRRIGHRYLIIIKQFPSRRHGLRPRERQLTFVRPDEVKKKGSRRSKTTQKGEDSAR